MGRWWAVPLLVTGLLSGCVEDEPSGFFEIADKVRCGEGPAELSLRIAAGLEGATGESSATLVATNRGPEVCRMIGYPELTLRDAEGRLLPTASTAATCPDRSQLCR